MHLNDNWQTPSNILDAVRLIMPVISLDPATSLDNPVHADNFCTGAPGTCGLELDWSGYQHIWVNHPYSQTTVWLRKINQTLDAGPSVQIINLAPMSLLSNVSTRRYLRHCYVVPLGRVKFDAPVALQQAREAQGRKGNPGSPRSDVALFMYRFKWSEAAVLASRFRSKVLELH